MSELTDALETKASDVGEMASDGRYSGLSEEHISLIRRLHATESHPDFQYQSIRVFYDEPAGIKINYEVLPDVEAGWEVNEDYDPKLNVNRDINSFFATGQRPQPTPSFGLGLYHGFTREKILRFRRPRGIYERNDLSKSQ